MRSVIVRHHPPTPQHGGGGNQRLGTLADPPRLGLGDQRPGRKRGGEKLLDHERDPVRARRELHDLSGTAGEPRHDATMATTSCRSSGASWRPPVRHAWLEGTAPAPTPPVGGRSWGTGQDLPQRVVRLLVR